jgi:hypothetical protein
MCRRILYGSSPSATPLLAMPIASSCKTAESQAFMLFMLLMSIASESDRIDLPDFAKRISGLLWLSQE